MRSFFVLTGSLTLVACFPLDASTSGSGGAGSSSTSSSSSSSSSGHGGASGLPCDVDAILASSCRSCHADPPRFGAPMPLVTYEDTQAPSKSDPSQRVFERMKMRLHDASAPMPPTGPLDAASLSAMDAWLDAGAKAGTSGSCGTGGAGAGGGPAVGPGALSCTPSSTLVAHAAGSADKFHVPEDGNVYQCFTFKSPWKKGTQGTAWAPILGDTRVLHHWILFKTSTPQVDGGVGPCSMPSDATFVAGWAPGGQNYELPKDVGLELAAPEESLILQVHYHNLAMYPDAYDASGVALCTTDTPRAHEAGIFTLGTVGIDVPAHAKGYQASGTCASWVTKYLSEPLTILASFPHMHTLGRAFRTEIHRGSDSGPVDTVVDVPHFSFDDQRYYDAPAGLQFFPGDSIKTTCTYDNAGSADVFFGEKTENEMCFDFVLLYPISIFQPGQRSCGLF